MSSEDDRAELALRPSAFFAWLVDHPVAVSMMFIAAMVFGWVSYNQLPVELMPDISYPKITVRTIYDGAAPQEVEGQISRRVEESLATLDGLVTIESRSRAGASDVVLGFDWGTDMDGAAQTIREQLQTTWLPTDADRPLILRYDPSLDPFLRLALSANSDEGASDSDEQAALLYELRDIAEQEIKRDLEGMSGVAAVRVRGGLEREIRVEVREDWLAAKQLTLDAVRTALVSENVNIAGGSIIEGDVEYLVRTLNQFGTVEELRALRLSRQDGVTVALADVAIVYETHREREVLSHLDGVEAVELEIFKEADANVVEVAARVKSRLEALDLPEQVVLAELDDQARFIEESVANLRDTAILGGLFAVGVLFLFLRDFRTTAIIGLAIPVSVVIGFAPLYLQGVTLNLMSLGGLALGIGMLVDNAVVVLESISRYREQGLVRREAAIQGASHVAAAVTASTLTTVAVFFPIAFVEGVGGQLFGDLSIAVVSSLLASLAVALFLVPMMAAREFGLPEQAKESSTEDRRDQARPSALLLGRPFRAYVLDDPMVMWRASRRWLLPYAVLRLVLQVVFNAVWGAVLVIGAHLLRWGWRLLTLLLMPVAWVLDSAAALFQRVYEPAERAYNAALRASMNRPTAVVLFAGALSVAAMQILPYLGTELLPELHQGRFTVETALPVGTPLDSTQQVVARAEQIAKSHPDVARVYATIGADRRADTSAEEGEHSARLRLMLEAHAQGAADETRIMEELRDDLAAPRLKLKFVRPSLFSFRTPIEVVLYGRDLDQMKQTGAAVADALGQVQGLRDVKSSLVAGHPEVRIRYDRDKLRRFGLDPATVAQRVRDKVQGVEATTIQRDDQQVDLRLQLVEGDRGTLADLRSINVNPSLVPTIPLDVVADFEEAEGPSEIRRVDQQRAVVVSANIEGFDLGSSAVAIEAAMTGLALPDGVTWEVAGQSKEMEESLQSLQFALMLAVFLVYVIMASTFENLVHPFVILFSVPLAMIGVVAGLVLWRLPVSVVVFIGAIVLAGVVVNNAIVLVDTINRLREEGRPRLLAIHEGGALRLRPILITTATTVLGLMPLSLGFGAGAEVQQPLAVAVIGGLFSSTALTLVVVPVVYGIFTGGLRSNVGTVSEPALATDGPELPAAGGSDA